MLPVLAVCLFAVESPLIVFVSRWGGESEPGAELCVHFLSSRQVPRDDRLRTVPVEHSAPAGHLTGSDTRKATGESGSYFN